MRWLHVVLLVVGCYSPSYRDCEVMCASGQCPAGLTCDNGVCRLPGMTGACGTMMMDGAPIDEASRDIPLDQLRDAQLAGVCGYYLRCGATEAVASCVEALESFQQFGLGVGSSVTANAIAAVAAGRAVYHADKAAECIAAYETYSCDRAPGASITPLACSQIFSGTLDANVACAIGETCMSQNCMTTSCNPGGCCTGTCLGNTPPSLKQLDQPCTFRDRCMNGYCDFTNPNAICVPFKTQGQACTSPRDCAQGLTCRTNLAGQPNLCEPPVENLGACMSTQDCRLFSNVCSSGQCVVGGLEGFSCPAAGPECQIFHSCVNSACRLPPAIGEPCMNGQSCRTGYCSGAQCVAKLADGIPCDPVRNGADCESGYCDSSTGRCAMRQVCF